MAQIEFTFPSENKQSTALSLCFCGWERCVPSHDFGPAVRKHYLIHFILNGKGKYYANNQEYDLKRNDGFLILPGKSTYYIADPEEPWEYFWIGFDGYEAKNLLKNCGLSENSLVFREKVDALLTENLYALLNLFEQAPSNKYALLGQFYTCFSYLEQRNISPKNSSDMLYYEKATDYIYENYTYDIKISDVAKYIGIDRTYLYKIFIQKSGLSPQQHLIQVRLHNAGNLLVNSPMTITEIAFYCGFKDSSSFYKHFKKYYGITPMQYQKTQLKLDIF